MLVKYEWTFKIIAVILLEQYLTYIDIFSASVLKHYEHNSVVKVHL